MHTLEEQDTNCKWVSSVNSWPHMHNLVNCWLLDLTVSAIFFSTVQQFSCCLFLKYAVCSCLYSVCYCLQKEGKCIHKHATAVVCWNGEKNNYHAVKFRKPRKWMHQAAMGIFGKPGKKANIRNIFKLIVASISIQFYFKPITKMNRECAVPFSIFVLNHRTMSNLNYVFNASEICVHDL